MPVHEGSDEGFWKVVLMFFIASFGFGFLAGILVMTRFFKASHLPAATIYEYEQTAGQYDFDDYGRIFIFIAI